MKIMESKDNLTGVLTDCSNSGPGEDDEEGVASGTAPVCLTTISTHSRLGDRILVLWNNNLVEFLNKKNIRKN